ncbi:uncharacterized protein LOC106877925 [Octopus bimaculoides]|nr:uncharacterized protein LOC106877925 [Octopus bimaculoides]
MAGLSHAKGLRNGNTNCLNWYLNFSKSHDTLRYLIKFYKKLNLEAINPDLGSLSSSSIEFIQDDTVHYGCRKRRGTSGDKVEGTADSKDEVEEEEDDEDEAAAEEEDPIEFIDFTDNVSSNDFIPLRQLPRNQPELSASHSTEKASPVSQDGSEDSSDSVTVLSVPNSDIENLPEDFWFDSDFELLNQQNFSDLAYLQLAARTGSGPNSSDQCDLKFRNSDLGNAICKNGISDASDADDECSNNAGSISAEEFEQNPPDSQLFSQTVSTVSATPTPMHSSQSEMSSLILNNQRNVPKWSCGFLIFLVLALGALHAISTHYYYGDTHFNIATDDPNLIKQMETVYQLNEQNKLLTKHVHSLKEELQNVLSSKHLLSEELHQMNNMLKNRISDLDVQIVELRQDISGVISKPETTDPSIVINEETDARPEDNEATKTAEFPSAPFTNDDANKKPDGGDERQHSMILVQKLEREIKRVELWKRLYFHKRCQSNDSSHSQNPRDMKSLNELLKELSFTALNFSGNGTLTLEAVKELMSSSVVELSQKAQNWKNYISEKLQNFTAESQNWKNQQNRKGKSRPSFRNLDMYAQKMMNKLHATKEKLQNKFQKTLGKISSKLDSFLLKNNLGSFFNLRKPEPIEKSSQMEAKTTLGQYKGKDYRRRTEGDERSVGIKKSLSKENNLQHDKYKESGKNTRRNIHVVNFKKETSFSNEYNRERSLNNEDNKVSFLNNEGNKKNSWNNEYNANFQIFSPENIDERKENKNKNHRQNLGKNFKETDKKHKDGCKKKDHLNKGKNRDFHKQEKREKRQLSNKEESSYSHKDTITKQEHRRKNRNNEKVRLYKLNEKKKTSFQVEEQKDHFGKQNGKRKKRPGRQTVKVKNQSENFERKQIKKKRKSDPSRKKFQTQGKHKFQRFSRKSSHNKELHREYSRKWSSKRSHNLGGKQHLKCRKRLSNIANRINKVSEENFSLMKHRKIRQLAFTLFHYNKDCLRETVQSQHLWPMCQQIWWSLCWQGLLIANPPNSLCYGHLLPWQLAVTASPASYVGCERCGCSYWSVHFNDTSSGESEENFSCQKIDCSNNFDSRQQQRILKNKMPMSGMWYFKEDSWRHYNGMEPTLEEKTNWYIKMMEARQNQHQQMH